MFVVFDLDGTIALTEHREHFLKRDPKDWRGFYAACDGDAPCEPLIRTALALNSVGAEVAIWSGRSDEVRDKTVDWLNAHGLLPWVGLRMRPAHDHQPDTKLKAAWLADGPRPDLVFEDRASMVEMWRSHGIVCAQVAPGDF